MVPEILSRFGKVKYVYLVGPHFDIYKVYLVFQDGKCYRVELKHPFYLIKGTEQEIYKHRDIDVMHPEDAYVKLTSCDYQDPDNVRPVISPHGETLLTIMGLLLESV